MAFARILVPVDLSHDDHTERLIDLAVHLASASHAELHLLYVDQSLIHGAAYPHLNQTRLDEHREFAMQKLATLTANLPAPVIGHHHCRQGLAHDQILEAAQALAVDAIVMMARKPGVKSYFIGSNAERVVRHAPCSVFVVRENQN
ncbi:MAG: universal stress protein [Pontibacterium sp.]